MMPNRRSACSVAAGFARAVVAACVLPGIAGHAAEPAAPEAATAQHWEWSGWGGGGFFWSCVWHPTDSRVLYLGGDVAGVYRSEDGGEHWQFANHGLANYAVYSLAISRSRPDVLYALTTGGVCRSADGARSWTFLAATAKGKLDLGATRGGSVRALAVDPTNPDIVYGGSHTGALFKTEDGGTTWRKLDYLAGLRTAQGRTALPAAAAGQGFLVLAYSSPAGDWNRNGRIEKYMGNTGADWSKGQRLAAQLRVPAGTPKLEAQLVVQTGDKWLWQAGPYVEIKPDTWTEVGLDMGGLKDLQTVRITYVVLRTPQAAYVGDVYVDAVRLQQADGTTVTVADWEKTGDVDGWRANRTVAEALFVTGIRQSAEPAVREKGVLAAVSVSEREPAVVFAANPELGVFRSADAGATWVLLQAPRGATGVAVSPVDASLVYAACGQAGVVRSTDRGESWSAANDGLAERCAIRELVPDPRDANGVFGIGNVDWNGFFYRSGDQGRHWQGSRVMARDPVGSPTLPDEPGGGQPPAGTADLSRTGNLAVCPADPNRLFIAANWRNPLSTDGGRTWSERVRGADITCTQDIRFHNGQVYVAAMDEGVLASADNGATWKPLAPRRYSEGVSGHQWRVCAWTRGGTTSVLTTASPWAGREEYANRVLLSADGGASFTTVTAGLPTYVPKVGTLWGQGYARALAQDPTNPDVLYLGIDGDPEPDKGRPGGGVFASRDGGRTWAPLPGQPAGRRVFFGLAVDPTQPQRLFWGACGNHGGIHRSEDGGQTWQHVFRQEGWVFNLMVAPDGTVYGGSHDLWRSQDHGATWRKITGFPAGDAVLVGMEVDPENPSRLWVSRVTWGEGAQGGVFASTDAGKTWQEITGDLPCRKPLVLRYNPATHDLWAGGVGLFRTRL